MNESKTPVVRSFAFKLLESVGTQLISFVVYIVLARLLGPTEYGVLAMLTIFTSIAQVFVQSGLNTALIQKKEINEADRSSVFWLSLGIAAALYALLFACAPMIAAYFAMPRLCDLMRVLALMLLPGALVSVQQAVAAREMKFKKLMISTLIATVLSGTLGIVMAYRGFGVWALVARELGNQLCLCAILTVTVRWRPRLVFDLGRVKTLVAFGWKLLVSSLIDTVYGKLRDLVIGKKYNSDTLAFFNKGKQFPELMMNVVNGSIQSVMLPVLSRAQDDPGEFKRKMRRSIMVSSYLVFPLMAGLAMVAKPLISVLLGAEWLPAVPFLQVCCVDFAFYPIHTANLQAINAMGRSDVFLKLEIVKKTYGVAILLISVFCFDSAFAIAAGGAVSTLISAFVNAFPNKRLLRYGYFQQMRDVLPPLLLSTAMAFCVALVTLLPIGALGTLCLQVVVGAAAYAALSVMFKPESFRYLIQTLAELRARRARKED